MALLALAVLALLPGLLVVRAPWTAVPALSLAFWAVSAWWLPASLSRGSFVSAALLVFSLLLVLRVVPKHEVPPPPGWVAPPVPVPPARPWRDPAPLRSGGSLVVVLAALLLLAPSLLWRHAPGPPLAYATTQARLLLWRDGIPASSEPLLPLAPYGAHAPAVATLAADVAALSGRDPARGVLVVLVAVASLAAIGLFALYATRLPPWAAALAALLALAVVDWPAWLQPLGAGEALVALAFLVPAAGLLVGHASRSSAVAAGLLVAAGALAHPLLALATVAVSAAVVLGRDRRPRRVALAACVAALLAAPGLLPLARALSGRELTAIATLPSARAALPAFGAVLVLWLVPLLALRLPPPRTPAGRIARALTVAMATVLLVVRVHAWIAAAQLPQPALAALARAAERTSVIDAVCAPDGVRDWVPALAGRAAGEPGPWIPAEYGDEWRSRTRLRCATAVSLPQ